MVLAKPSRTDTVGSQPNSFLAIVMSGLRFAGSSLVAGKCTIWLSVFLTSSCGLKRQNGER